MSFMQTRMTMLEAREVDFTGATFAGRVNLKNVSFPYLTKQQVQNDIRRVTAPGSAGYDSNSYPSGRVIHGSDGNITVA